MMSVRLGSSENFVWDYDRELGHGATCTVYLGWRKLTGEEVAVKVFSGYDRRPLEVKIREYEVLRKLNHRNVVSLLAVEEEVKTRKDVMVLEYCDGGSLFSLLDEPANGYGLPEPELLLVIRHVAEGMKHLRDHNIVHRDIKPGNILRCLGQDGRSIYKLTDFGAARELPDGGPFSSLYGTEEYLHPDMYKHALIHRDGQRNFCAEVDLWSIGVTYFHAATGVLPFRSFRGRGDRAIMHQIISQKKPGVISGVQVSEMGNIQWSRELPPTCPLSQGLKPLLTRFLAGLMEARKDLVWSFEKFFLEAEFITSRVRVDFFCPSMAAGFALALDSTDNMSKLKESIAVETEVKATDQLLILDGRRLAEWVQPLTPISNYPPTSPERPIFVLTRSLQEFAPLSRSETGTFPSLRPEINRDHDFSQARRCCQVTCSHLHRIRQLHLHSSLLHTAVDYYCRELERRQQEVWMEWQQTSSSARLVLQWAETFLCMASQLACLVTNLSSTTKSQAQLQAFLQQSHQQTSDALKPTADKLQSQLQVAGTEVQQCMQENLKASSLRAAWDANPGRPPSDNSDVRVEMSLKRMKNITVLFRSIRESKTSLSRQHNDDQIHKLEKAKLMELCATVHSLHKDHCLTQAQSYYSLFQSWASASMTSWSRCEQTEQRLCELQGLEEQLSTAMVKMCRAYLEELNRQTELLQREAGSVLDGLKESYTMIEHSDVDASPSSTMSGPRSGASPSPSTATRTSSASSRPQVLVTLLDGLKDSRTSLEEVMDLVKENCSLMQKFSPLPDCTMPWEQISGN